MSGSGWKTMRVSLYPPVHPTTNQHMDTKHQASRRAERSVPRIYNDFTGSQRPVTELGDKRATLRATAPTTKDELSA